jgi:hypothetical protein
MKITLDPHQSVCSRSVVIEITLFLDSTSFVKQLLVITVCRLVLVEHTLGGTECRLSLLCSQVRKLRLYLVGFFRLYTSDYQYFNFFPFSIK